MLLFGKITCVKTQIIHLEVHDDTISVRDKMDWSQTPRVLLVWPDRGKVLRSRLDLVLLERYCTSHGSQLALVTMDPEVIYQAGEVGIPVFSSRATAQIQPWRKSFREFNRRELIDKAAEGRDFELDPTGVKEQSRDLPAWARISIFITALLGVLSVLGMLLPAATIVIDRDQETHSMIIPVQAVEGASQTNLSGIVPIREIQITVDGQVNINTSGSIMIPAEIASGEVIFTNLGEDQVTIPEGTVLSTSGEDPIQFLTTDGGKISGGIGETLVIPVSALTPGEVGNLPPGKINTIGGGLGAILSVSNLGETTGGEDIQVKAPNASDRRQAERLLSAALLAQVRDQLEAMLQDDDIQLSSNLSNFIVLEEEFEPKDDQPGAELIVSKEIKFIVPYTSQFDLEQLAEDLVLAQYQDMAFAPLVDTIQVKNFTSPQRQTIGNYSWQIEISWQDQKNLDHDQIIQIALGKNREQAILQIQKQFKLENKPQVNLSPVWWFRLPVLPFRIEIVEGGS